MIMYDIIVMVDNVQQQLHLCVFKTYQYFTTSKIKCTDLIPRQKAFLISSAKIYMWWQGGRGVKEQFLPKCP